MEYRGVRVGVCLLALCGIAPNMGVRSHGVVTTVTPLVEGSQQAIDVDFASGVRQKRSEQARGSRLSLAVGGGYDSGAAFSGDPRIGLAGRTGKEWSNSNNDFEADRYVTSSAANDAALSRTTGILCAEYNLCIDYDPPATRFGDWQGNVAPLDGSYLSSKKYGWSYGDVLVENGSAPAGSIYPANIAAGDLMPVAPTTTISNAVDQGSGLVRSGTMTQSALATGNSGVLNVAAVGATEHYQAANSHAMTGSISSDYDSNQNDPLHLEGGSPAPRVTPAVIQHASQPGSDSTHGVDSELRAAGDQIINQSAGSVNWWPTETLGPTSDVPLEFHNPGPMYQFPSTSLTGPPNPGVNPTDPVLDPASPVPEPSELLLMFTVVALVALAAKRSTSKYRVAGRTGLPTS